MALIKCPECGKEVSDKAETCIHCGYPITRGTTQQKILSQGASTIPNASRSVGFSLFSVDNEYISVECKYCKKVYKYKRLYFNEISPARCVPNTLIRCPNCANTTPANSPILGEKKTVIKPEKLRCPRCQSTLVTTGQRGFSIWTGFIGSNKTVNRCGKCGHSWTPK